MSNIAQSKHKFKPGDGGGGSEALKCESLDFETYFRAIKRITKSSTLDWSRCLWLRCSDKLNWSQNFEFETKAGRLYFTVIPLHARSYRHEKFYTKAKSVESVKHSISNSKLR